MRLKSPGVKAKRMSSVNFAKLKSFWPISSDIRDGVPTVCQDSLEFESSKQDY